jgi:hypothetical protein
MNERRNKGMRYNMFLIKLVYFIGVMLLVIKGGGTVRVPVFSSYDVSFNNANIVETVCDLCLYPSYIYHLNITNNGTSNYNNDVTLTLTFNSAGVISDTDTSSGTGSWSPPTFVVSGLSVGAGSFLLVDITTSFDSFTCPGLINITGELSSAEVEGLFLTPKLSYLVESTSCPQSVYFLTVPDTPIDVDDVTRRDYEQFKNMRSIDNVIEHNTSTCGLCQSETYNYQIYIVNNGSLTRTVTMTTITTIYDPSLLANVSSSVGTATLTVNGFEVTGIVVAGNSQQLVIVTLTFYPFVQCCGNFSLSSSLNSSMEVYSSQVNTFVCVSECPTANDVHFPGYISIDPIQHTNVSSCDLCSTGNYTVDVDIFHNGTCYSPDNTTLSSIFTLPAGVKIVSANSTRGTVSFDNFTQEIEVWSLEQGGDETIIVDVYVDFGGSSSCDGTFSVWNTLGSVPIGFSSQLYSNITFHECPHTYDVFFEGYEGNNTLIDVYQTSCGLCISDNYTFTLSIVNNRTSDQNNVTITCQPSIPLNNVLVSEGYLVASGPTFEPFYISGLNFTAKETKNITITISFNDIPCSGRIKVYSILSSDTVEYTSQEALYVDYTVCPNSDDIVFVLQNPVNSTCINSTFIPTATVDCLHCANTTATDYDIKTWFDFPPGTDLSTTWQLALNGSFVGSETGLLDNSSSVLTILHTWITNGHLVVNWSVSSEPEFDCFQIYIDGIPQLLCLVPTCNCFASGEKSAVTTLNVTAGAHNITFVYSKDLDVSEGFDRAFIYEIVFGESNNPFCVMCPGSVPNHFEVENGLAFNLCGTNQFFYNLTINNTSPNNISDVFINSIFEFFDSAIIIGVDSSVGTPILDNPFSISIGNLSVNAGQSLLVQILINISDIGCDGSFQIVSNVNSTDNTYQSMSEFIVNYSNCTQGGPCPPCQISAIVSDETAPVSLVVLSVSEIFPEQNITCQANIITANPFETDNLFASFVVGPTGIFFTQCPTTPTSPNPLIGAACIGLPNSPSANLTITCNTNACNNRTIIKLASANLEVSGVVSMILDCSNPTIISDNTTYFVNHTIQTEMCNVCKGGNLTYQLVLNVTTLTQSLEVKSVFNLPVGISLSHATSNVGTTVVENPNTVDVYIGTAGPNQIIVLDIIVDFKGSQPCTGNFSIGSSIFANQLLVEYVDTISQEIAYTPCFLDPTVFIGEGQINYTVCDVCTSDSVSFPITLTNFAHSPAYNVTINSTLFNFDLDINNVYVSSGIVEFFGPKQFEITNITVPSFNTLTIIVTVLFTGVDNCTGVIDFANVVSQGPDYLPTNQTLVASISYSPCNVSCPYSDCTINHEFPLQYDFIDSIKPSQSELPNQLDVITCNVYARNETGFAYLIMSYHYDSNQMIVDNCGPSVLTPLNRECDGYFLVNKTLEMDCCSNGTMKDNTQISVIVDETNEQIIVRSNRDSSNRDNSNNHGKRIAFLPERAKVEELFDFYFICPHNIIVKQCNTSLDCDDQNNCTIDLCLDNWICDHNPVVSYQGLNNVTVYTIPPDQCLLPGTPIDVYVNITGDDINSNLTVKDSIITFMTFADFFCENTHSHTPELQECISSNGTVIVYDGVIHAGETCIYKCSVSNLMQTITETLFVNLIDECSQLHEITVRQNVFVQTECDGTHPLCAGLLAITKPCKQKFVPGSTITFEFDLVNIGRTNLTVLECNINATGMVILDTSFDPIGDTLVPLEIVPSNFTVSILDGNAEFQIVCVSRTGQCLINVTSISPTCDFIAVECLTNSDCNNGNDCDIDTCDDHKCLHIPKDIEPAVFAELCVEQSCLCPGQNLTIELYLKLVNNTGGVHYPDGLSIFQILDENITTPSLNLSLCEIVLLNRTCGQHCDIVDKKAWYFDGDFNNDSIINHEEVWKFTCQVPVYGIAGIDALTVGVNTTNSCGQNTTTLSNTVKVALECNVSANYSSLNDTTPCRSVSIIRTLNVTTEFELGSTVLINDTVCNDGCAPLVNITVYDTWCNQDLNGMTPQTLDSGPLLSGDCRVYLCEVQIIEQMLVEEHGHYSMRLESSVKYEEQYLRTREMLFSNYMNKDIINGKDFDSYTHTKSSNKGFDSKQAGIPNYLNSKEQMKSIGGIDFYSSYGFVNTEYISKIKHFSHNGKKSNKPLETNTRSKEGNFKKHWNDTDDAMKNYLGSSVVSAQTEFCGKIVTNTSSNYTCDDGDPCTIDYFDSWLGCIHDPIIGCCLNVSDCPAPDPNAPSCYVPTCTILPGADIGCCSILPSDLVCCDINNPCPSQAQCGSLICSNGVCILDPTTPYNETRDICDDDDECTNDRCDIYGNCINVGILNCDNKKCGDSVRQWDEECDGEECCTDNCKIAPRSVVCRHRDDHIPCSRNTHCNGFDPYCPPPDTSQCDIHADYFVFNQDHRGHHHHHHNTPPPP